MSAERIALRKLTGLEFLVPLLFFAWMGKVLQVTRGLYSFGHLEWLVPALAVFGAWIALRGRGARELGFGAVSSPRALAIAFAIQAVWVVDQPLLTYHERRDFYLVFKIMLAGAALVSFGLVVAAWLRPLPADREGRGRDQGFLRACLAAAVLLLVGKVFAVLSTPRPFIDVFTTPTIGADYLLHGLNPYSHPYPDIYQGRYDYAPAYAYWPGLLLVQTVARVLTGDIRMAFVAADALTGWALWRIANRLRWPRRSAALLPLVWFTIPVVFHVLEMAWIDTLLICFGTLTVWAMLARRWWIAGAALGYFCAVKQYSVFFALLCGAWALREEGWTAARKLTLAAVGVFAAVLAPFLAWDPGAFVHSTITQILSQGMRLDSLSIPAALANQWGTQIGGAPMAASYLLAFAASCFLVLRAERGVATAQAWAAGLVITYGTVFLMGKQSFCNYYYLLEYFVLLYFLMRMAETKAGTSPEASARTPGRPR